ncbi:hypothetical protein LCGC14_2355420, partial [marine sediment metagenome]
FLMKGEGQMAKQSKKIKINRDTSGKTKNIARDPTDEAEKGSREEELD